MAKKKDTRPAKINGMATRPPGRVDPNDKNAFDQIKLLPYIKPEDMSMSSWMKSNLYRQVRITPKDGSPEVRALVGDIIIQKQLESAMKGDTGAAEFVMDRAFGKPKQTIEQLGDIPSKLTIEVIPAKKT